MKINLTCPVNSLGYGVVGLNVILALEALGHEVAWWPIGQVEAPPEHHPTLTRCVKRAEFFGSAAPSIRLYHQFSLDQHVGMGLHVGFPIFELNRFKPIERHHISYQHKVFVPSQWAADVCISENASTRDRLHVVPLGVDPTIFYPTENDVSETTTFLNIGKWEIRKGHDVLVEAFNKAFTPKDDVRLIMNCYNPCFQNPAQLCIYNADWVRTYKSGPMANKIEVLEGRLGSQRDVAQLMAQADCGVFPARAEGWNLELGEMLAMGKEVITTAYAAHMEFCDTDNARLIDIDELEDAHDGVWFNATDPQWRGNPGQWAHLGEDQVDQLVENMRGVHFLKQAGEQKPNAAGIETMKRFTWQRTAEAIVEGLQ